jgi:hypothetical protein
MDALFILSLGCGFSVRPSSCDAMPGVDVIQVITVHGHVFLRPTAGRKAKFVYISKRKTQLFPHRSGWSHGVVSTAIAMLQVHSALKVNN